MKKKSDRDLPTEEAARKKRENLLYLVVILLNSILFYGVFAVLTQFPFWMTVEIVYLVLLVAFGAFYVVYNRGFTRKNVTVDMLPDTMSEEEKEAYVSDGERRLRKSKWCITILFPLIFTFFMDIFYLFIYEPHFSETFAGLFG